MERMVRKLSLIFYYGFAQFLPTQPVIGWKIAYKIRRMLVEKIFMNCGKDVIIKSKAYFGNGENVVIGDRSQIGANCKMENDLIIGDDVVMGPDIVIMSSSHAYNRLDIPINKQGALPRRPPKIGNDVWIGTRVVILPGVTIGDQAVIGANTVVTKDVPPKAVFAGCPGRVIRWRGQEK